MVNSLRLKKQSPISTEEGIKTFSISDTQFTLVPILLLSPGIAPMVSFQFVKLISLNEEPLSVKAH